MTIESKGSVWYVDVNRQRYIRVPKTEGPRWSPPGRDWGGPNAEPGLQDLVEHEFTTFRVTQDEFLIDIPEGRYTRAPLVIPYGGLEPPDTERSWVYDYAEGDWQ